MQSKRSTGERVPRRSFHCKSVCVDHDFCFPTIYIAVVMAVA
jgi:hypothetical protein